jgi:hypothetical protein
MTFPTTAIGPDGKVRSILVDATGKLVTTQNPKPAVTYPITQRSLVVDNEGKVRTT